MLLQYEHNPYRILITAFTAWKALLLAIAAGSCVGPSYDTSAALLLSEGVSGSNSSNDSTSPLGLLATRLTSWDAIYFIKAANRGYLFEQEWAFGAGLPNVISAVAKALKRLGLAGSGSSSLEPLVGVTVSHATHLISVLVLYRLGQLIWKDRKVAFIAALLHVISPAGLFLSAPYNESPFSCLSFAGYLLLAQGYRLGERAATQRDILLVLAGCAFGLATTFRSNGLLNGIPFAYGFLLTSLDLVRRPSAAACRSLVVLGVGGLCVAAGSLIPQYLAYQSYCSGASGSGGPRRPWCDKLMPSIYSFVQEHYWNTGFLRYWTVSNVPLFLLAAPMLSVLTRSGIDMLHNVREPAEASPEPQKLSVREGKDLSSLVQCMAAAQVLIAVMTLMSYHVQIINRLSSGYPVWYWWLAGELIHPSKSSFGSKFVAFMVVYASIQAVLFASFLPPA
ncbi:GPI mannosyltransferase 2 [Pleurostoma richardsiae]|uniref:GPI mannosyltransferase 2 n=1 Tax=Pleurostoma richardsiae TaxID=41990 RepID=A0AA38RJX8_9PEZI|nr:GPI mannosyltransferase 2 [Pleurostoma richardsiae]